MAYYKDLPIWCDAMRPAVEMELAVRSFPRHHKYTLGADKRRDKCFEAKETLSNSNLSPYRRRPVSTPQQINYLRRAWAPAFAGVATNRALVFLMQS